MFLLKLSDQTCPDTQASGLFSGSWKREELVSEKLKAPCKEATLRSEPPGIALPLGNA